MSDINITSPIHHPSFGNGLTPSYSIPAGTTLISITNPLLILVEAASLSSVCSFCFTTSSSATATTTLKRCASCKVPHYCSASCQKRDWSAIHSKECGILKKLPQCPPTPVRALMQLLLKHRLGGKLDPRWEGLGGHVDEFKRQGGSRWDGFVMQAQGGVRFSGFGKGLREGEAVELGIQMLCRMATNAFRVTTPDDTPVGLCFEPVLALANHSCSPNATILFNGRTTMLRSLTPIKAGEQIFISYIDPIQSRETRKTELKERYFFECKCVVCKGNENPYQTFLRVNESKAADGKDELVDLWWKTTSHLTTARNLVDISSTIDLSTTATNHITSLLTKSRTVESDAERLSLLTQAVTHLKPITSSSLYAIPPFPALFNDIYLHHLTTSSYIEALTFLLFTSLHIDPYTYPQPHHPIRVARLFTLALLLKHIASLSTPELLPPPTTPFNEEQREKIRNIDYISCTHVFLIFAHEQGILSHGVGSAFLKEVEGELRDVEEVQRGRGDGGVGRELRRWVVQGDLAVQGRLLGETLIGGLNEVVGFMGGSLKV